MHGKNIENQENLELWENWEYNISFELFTTSFDLNDVIDLFKHKSLIIWEIVIYWILSWNIVFNIRTLYSFLTRLKNLKWLEIRIKL